jgi:hypothetical protein
VAFTIISIYVSITAPFVLVPMGLTCYAQFKVAMSAYDNFFSEVMRPRQSRIENQKMMDDELRIHVQGGTFRWKVRFFVFGQDLAPEDACDQRNSSRESTASYRYHHKSCRNTEGRGEDWYS